MKDVNNIVGNGGLVEFGAEVRRLHQAGQEETANALMDSLQATIENRGGDTEEETENENARRAAISEEEARPPPPTTCSLKCST